MNRDELRALIDRPDALDEVQGESLRGMIRDFYSRKLRSVAILVWSWALLFLAGALFSVVRFGGATDTKAQIMYAALFVCCVQGMGHMKTFAWSMIQRHSLRREIKRLELSVVELVERLGGDATP